MQAPNEPIIKPDPGSVGSLVCYRKPELSGSEASTNQPIGESGFLKGSLALCRSYLKTRWVPPAHCCLARGGPGGLQRLPWGTPALRQECREEVPGRSVGAAHRSLARHQVPARRRKAKSEEA